MKRITDADLQHVRAVLIDVRDNGLIYWEPNTRRGAASKAAMVARVGMTIDRLEFALLEQSTGG